jgi:hypothetical protein
VVIGFPLTGLRAKKLAIKMAQGLGLVGSENQADLHWIHGLREQKVVWVTA